jgi:hypothetical protein
MICSKRLMSDNNRWFCLFSEPSSSWFPQCTYSREYTISLRLPWKTNYHQIPTSFAVNSFRKLVVLESETGMFSLLLMELNLNGKSMSPDQQPSENAPDRIPVPCMSSLHMGSDIIYQCNWLSNYFGWYHQVYVVDAEISIFYLLGTISELIGTANARDVILHGGKISIKFRMEGCN